jgi:SM-20-related protein
METTLPADFFTRVGLFVIKHFFDAELCARLESEVCNVISVPATIRKEGFTHLVDETVRKTNRAKISATTKTMVQTRLLNLKPQLEQHFDVTLRGCESPQFLVYKSGYFYGPHRDSSADSDAPEYVRERRISVIIFLNSDAALLGRDGYSGGSLTLYGLIDDAGWKSYGFPLIAQPGLLVAFKSDTIHEVTPIIAGERYSIVTWFF